MRLDASKSKSGLSWLTLSTYSPGLCKRWRKLVYDSRLRQLLFKQLMLSKHLHDIPRNLLLISSDQSEVFQGVVFIIVSALQ